MHCRDTRVSDVFRARTVHQRSTTLTHILLSRLSGVGGVAPRSFRYAETFFSDSEIS